MSEQKKNAIHEDWTVVVLGALIIILSIAGLVLEVPAYSWSNSGELLGKLLSASNLSLIFIQFIFVSLIAAIGAFLTGKPLKHFLLGFLLVYLITIIALILAGNSQVKAFNLEAVIFSLGLGLIISNSFKMPEWLRSSLSTELFVKIGLVLLGTSVIFSDVLKAGSLGLIQALAVVLSVWYFAFWLCKKMKIDDELTMMISSAVSICGVSAAIATSGAIKGDSKKLSYVISMVLITAIPMMIFMPMIAKYFDLSQEVTGAWLGGSIDTTGAVVASGSLVGETALKISTIVKFSQNVLLGLAAFAISVYWTYTKHPKANDPDGKPGLKVIWQRFPKFVLGFLAASLLFSFVLSPEVSSSVKGSLKNLQGLWFALAFTSIGLETNFADLFNKQSKKPFYAFLIAQGFNVIVTLIIALILFT
ncbi:MAG: sulfate transporter [Sphingobacteriales bacterium 17-39-43]|uniref:YeiH family protein n=1 Tax=Daejeonella sp. TaxID=2805397 RepID=UPI000BC4607C|nr:putative sulfate exporter family transporter [Daejeonella sp.]OYZ33078.1 MAG: sulfate transporter [Sphingobacteriales bacterium 16-39-50]OYZ57156.1 MAG: sulfate transporter [Sphingobacteriales bacterium 24-40-4]OZA26487.1 MAG: sulfate transporter [Sphingobacteriales bacterium 17-39-43]OZA61606.1 MAG: sulfate transporter [Sphingobacteriales bacterium 39-40-5]HQS50815.1 putative sulfate exporter family transporter [Daejeonella sp.]